jgi:hypothetical protein
MRDDGSDAGRPRGRRGQAAPPPVDYLASSTRWFLPDSVPKVWRPRNPDPEAAFRECMAEVARLANASPSRGEPKP